MRATTTNKPAMTLKATRPVRLRPGMIVSHLGRRAVVKDIEYLRSIRVYEITTRGGDTIHASAGGQVLTIELATPKLAKVGETSKGWPVLKVSTATLAIVAGRTWCMVPMGQHDWPAVWAVAMRHEIDTTGYVPVTYLGLPFCVTDGTDTVAGLIAHDPATGETKIQIK